MLILSVNECLFLLGGPVPPTPSPHSLVSHRQRRWGSPSPLGWSGGDCGGGGALEGSWPPLGCGASDVSSAELVEMAHSVSPSPFPPLHVPASPLRPPQRLLPERRRSHRRPSSILSGECSNAPGDPSGHRSPCPLLTPPPNESSLSSIYLARTPAW